MTKSNLKRNLSIAFLFLLTFFIIYNPEVSIFISIRSQYLVFLAALLISIGAMIKAVNVGYLNINKQLLIFCMTIMVASLYFAFRAGVSGYPNRLLQNNFIIVQIIVAVYIVNRLAKIGFTRENVLNFIFGVAMLQSFFCILMILIPSFREVALKLYYVGREENVFISAIRIYGISGDYTFFTPVFHGFLAALACILAVLKNYKYLFYVPFLLLAILLNGRIGLVVFVFGTLVGFVMIMFLKSNHIPKLIMYFFLFSFLLVICLNIIKVAAPSTYTWIEGGINDTINLVFNDQKTGNYAALSTSVNFPEGLGFIFGEGIRVYGGNALMYGFPSSDIGYVNDMFMGGLIYCAIQYSAIVAYCLKYPKEILTKDERLLNQVVAMVSVVTLLIANYKGEVMRSGIALLIVVIVKYILIKNFEKKGVEQ